LQDTGHSFLGSGSGNGGARERGSDDSSRRSKSSRKIFTSPKLIGIFLQNLVHMN
jgi:hypothetical protein